MVEYEQNILSSEESEYLIDQLDDYDSIIIHPNTISSNGLGKGLTEQSIFEIVENCSTLADLFKPKAFAERNNLKNLMSGLEYADIIIFSNPQIYHSCVANRTAE